jgi:Myb-like DNA-binding domain
LLSFLIRNKANREWEVAVPSHAKKLVKDYLSLSLKWNPESISVPLVGSPEPMEPTQDSQTQDSQSERRTGQWDDDEKIRCRQAINDFGTDYVRISEHVGSRDVNQVYMFCRYYKDQLQNTGYWSEIEKMRFHNAFQHYGKAVESYVQSDYEKISDMVVTRSAEQVRAKIKSWIYSIKNKEEPTPSRGTRWTREEKAAFDKGVKKYGQDAERIATMIPTRTVKQIRVRLYWSRQTPEQKKRWSEATEKKRKGKRQKVNRKPPPVVLPVVANPWTEVEDALLVKALSMSKYKTATTTSWTQITEDFFPGRATEQVRHQARKLSKEKSKNPQKKWKPAEHAVFLKGMQKFPNQWVKIKAYMKTSRTTTALRYHAKIYKKHLAAYHQKLDKEMGQSTPVLSDESEGEERQSEEDESEGEERQSEEDESEEEEWQSEEDESEEEEWQSEEDESEEEEWQSEEDESEGSTDDESEGEVGQSTEDELEGEEGPITPVLPDLGESADGDLDRLFVWDDVEKIEAV